MALEHADRRAAGEVRPIGVEDLRSIDFARASSRVSTHKAAAIRMYEISSAQT
jgi:hypothetical protein